MSHSASRVVAFFFVFLIGLWSVLLLSAWGLDAARLDVFPLLVVLFLISPAAAAIVSVVRAKAARLVSAWLIAVCLALVIYAGGTIVAVQHSRDILVAIFGHNAAAPAGDPTSSPQFDPTEDRVRGDFARMLRSNPGFKSLIWPPPTPSAVATIPSRFFGASSTLADVADHLDNSLGHIGYSRFSYFYAPFGFAMVTGVEQIADDGSPLRSSHRWLAEPAIEFSLAGYLTLLLNAPIGRYRAIIFLVTTDNYSPSSIRLTRDETRLMAQSGDVRLPSLYRTVPFRDPYRLDALIYEFEGRAGSDPVLVNPSKIPGVQHLARAGLWAVLESSSKGAAK